MTKRQILHVEDNHGDVRLVQEALQNARYDYQVTVARDGVEGLDCLHRRGGFAATPRPELILLDLNLPRKSGYEVLSEIKHDKALRTIPVIVFTSSAASADILKAYEMGANCYVTKPSDIDDLFHIIKAIEAFWFDVAVLASKLAE
ncbi:MAG: response regulator [Deltaproteobacteria bacterium]|nr:response regulator [Deltaproteobacteria bacterium]